MLTNKTARGIVDLVTYGNPAALATPEGRRLLAKAARKVRRESGNAEARLMLNEIAIMQIFDRVCPI